VGTRRDPDSQARGRFLWAGVTATKYRDQELIEDRLYYTATGEIAAVASAGHAARWVADLLSSDRPVTRGDWAWDNTFDRVTVRVCDPEGARGRAVAAAAAQIWATPPCGDERVATL
jgi:hypothetical protein